MTEQEESYLLQSYNENESLFGNINSSFQWNPLQPQDRVMRSRKHEFTSIYNQLNSEESIRSSRNKQYRKTPKLGANDINKENRQVIQLDVKMLDSIWEQIPQNETTAFKYTKRDYATSKIKTKPDDHIVRNQPNIKLVQYQPSLQLLNKNVKNKLGRIKSEAAEIGYTRDNEQIFQEQQKYLKQKTQQGRNFTIMLPILDEFFYKYQILNQQICSYQKIVQNMQFLIKEQQKYIETFDSYFGYLAKKLQALAQYQPSTINYHLQHFRSNLNLITSEISDIFHKSKLNVIKNISTKNNIKKTGNIENISVDMSMYNINEQQKGQLYETQPTERFMNKQVAQVAYKLNEKQSVINIIDAQTPEVIHKQKRNKYQNRQVTQFCDFTEHNKDKRSFMHLKSCSIQYSQPQYDTSTYRKLTNLRIQQMQGEIKLLENSLHNSNIKMMVLKNENKELREILEGLISQINKSKNQKIGSLSSFEVY